MMVVAPDFVPVVLGERWTDAVPVLQILATVGLLQSLMMVGGSTLNAVGRFGTVLRFTVATYAANVIAFVAGLSWGIVGVATGYAIATAVFFPVFTWISARAIGSSVRAFAGALSGVVQASVVMVGCVLATRLLLVEEGVPAGARLAVLVLVGAVVYIACCAWRAPELREELGQLLRRRRRRRGLKAAAPAGAAR